MFVVNLTEAQEVKAKGTQITLQQGTFSVSEEFCKENDFIQCGTCKEWFDYGWFVGEFHPQYEKSNKKNYCEKCFNLKYK